MKDKIQKLHDFMEHLRKWEECSSPEEEWTDCPTIEQKLVEARSALGEIGITEEETVEIRTIISDLEQMQKVCSLPSEIMDDDAVCGV